MQARIAPLLIILLTASVAATTPWKQEPAPQQEGVGYTDTPMLPGQKWRVHDKNRPVPEKITPPTASTQEQAGKPPSDAVVLFDGTNLDAWNGSWKVEDGAMTVNGTGDLVSKESFGSVQLHVEWRSPVEPDRSSQGKGNSGVFLMGRYEIQVLNSYSNRSYADGQAAAIYGQYPPDVNACRPEGQWQSYDIVFTAPTFDKQGALLTPAYATVFHNGILVHNHRALIGATGHRTVGMYKAHPAELPLKLQDHGNPVSYRNVWVRRL